MKAKKITPQEVQVNDEVIIICDYSERVAHGIVSSIGNKMLTISDRWDANPIEFEDISNSFLINRPEQKLPDIAYCGEDCRCGRDHCGKKEIAETICQYIDRRKREEARRRFNIPVALFMMEEEEKNE